MIDNNKCVLNSKSAYLNDFWRIMWHWRLDRIHSFYTNIYINNNYVIYTVYYFTVDFPYKNVDKSPCAYRQISKLLYLISFISKLLIISKSPVHSYSAEPVWNVALCWSLSHQLAVCLSDLISFSSDRSSHSPLVSCWALSCVSVLSLSACVCWSLVRQRPCVCVCPGWKPPGSWSPAVARQHLYPGRWAVCGQALMAGLQTTAGTPAWLQREIKCFRQRKTDRQKRRSAEELQIRAAHVRLS